MRLSHTPATVAVVPLGQVAVPAAWSTVKSSTVNPPGTADRVGAGLTTSECPRSASSARVPQIRRPTRLAWLPARVRRRADTSLCGLADRLPIIGGAAGFGQGAVGDDAGVWLDRNVGIEPVLTTRHRLVRVPRLRVHGGDDPIRGDPLRDTPAPVRAVRLLDRLHVLTRDQRQQRKRLGGFRVALGVGQVPEQAMRVADQVGSGGLVVPGDRGLTCLGVVVVRRSPPRRQGPRGRSGGSRRSTGSPCPGWPPRHRAPWNPTPAASSRQCPGLRDHVLDRLENPVRPFRSR